VRLTAGFVSNLTQKTLGRFVPQFIKDLCVKTVTTVDEFTQSITPSSLIERRQQCLSQQAEQQIMITTRALNSVSGQQINAQDFNKMSAAAVQGLADKVSLIHYMVSLEKCLTLYQQEHSIGLTKFSLSRLFKPITTLLSKTFMRRLIFNGVLLALEAEKLKTKVERLIQKSKGESEFDKAQVKDELKLSLKMTQTRTTRQLTGNWFVFFQREAQIATDNFKGVVSKAAELLTQSL
jgi:hypothetical protein